MIAEIVRECEVGQERQRELEQEHHRIREDQQEHQQEMMEMLEKVSDQVKKVENIYSGSVPVIEGEYYTPPVSQMRMNMPSKVSPPPKSTYIFRTGTSTKYRRVNRSMAFPGGRCFSNPHRESSLVSSDMINQRSSP